jgi:hypothetical protein
MHASASSAYRIATLRPHPQWLTRRHLEPFAVRSVPSRFCDGTSGYAVLYAAAELETAFLETAVRDRFVQRGERRIPLTDLTGRGWVQFTTQGKSPLSLLDIRAEGCVIVGVPTDVLRARHQVAGRAALSPNAKALRAFG